MVSRRGRVYEMNIAAIDAALDVLYPEKGSAIFSNEIREEMQRAIVAWSQVVFGQNPEGIIDGLRQRITKADARISELEWQADNLSFEIDKTRSYDGRQKG